jgi:beta-lactamase superfamily II metal-dependent hydrolase
MKVDRPSADTFELSIFGPGVGEGMVLHLGGGEWVVVDSCVERATDRPVALSYLEEIGVDAGTAIRLVVATHWHDDHTSGVAEILRAAPSALFVLSASLSSKEALTIVQAAAEPHMQDSGVGALFDALQAVKAAKLRLGERLRWAKADTLLYRSVRAEVTALSPTDATQTRSFIEIGDALFRRGAPRRKLVSQTPNDLAVALWVEAGAISALLGSDLERGRDASSGWRGIVSSQTRPAGRAVLFKVPHHGSNDAHEPAVWTTLLEPRTYSVLTPYRAKREPLPTAQDRERLSALSHRLFGTADAKPSRHRPKDRLVERALKRTGIRLFGPAGPMGHVRLRADLATGSIEWEMRGPAWSTSRSEA